MKSMTLHEGAIAYLRNYKMFNGGWDNKVLSGIPFPEGTPKRIKVIVRPVAYLKMVRLIMDFTTEVGWHGICHRDANDPTTYIIEDVMVYPQDVTGSTIKTDVTRMTQWLDQYPDEIFKQIRFHGHSHVNMGVFSSGTDDDLQRDLIGMMRNPEDFYLFFIMNKRLEIFVRLYDNKYGVMYESADTDIFIMDETTDIVQFLQDSKAQVKAVSYTPPANQNRAGNAPQSGDKQSLPPAYSGGKNSKSSWEEDYLDGDDFPLGYWNDAGRFVSCEGRYYQ